MSERANAPRLGNRLRPVTGAIDAAARLPSGQGWILLGWTPLRWAEQEGHERLYAELSLGSVTGEAVTCFFHRDDAPPEFIGFCTILEGSSLPQASLNGVEIPALRLRLPLLPRETPLGAMVIAAMARSWARRAHGAQDIPLLAHLPRPPFDGRDTLPALWPPVHFELDQALHVPPDGLALIGWFVDTGASVAALSVCGVRHRARLDPQAWLPIPRADIFQQFGKQYGLEDDRLGFLAFAPQVGEAKYLEIETIDGGIAYKPLRVLHRPRLGVIKQLLSVPRPPALRLQHAFDTVLGPIVDGLNMHRAAKPPHFADRVFGVLPAAPLISVVVALYGRVDFMEYQQALFCERPDPAVELIYVLDDPALTEEAERLAFSCWARFQLPFRLLFLTENLGYAGANNVGLGVARGTYLCLLNSDVFPGGSEGLSWLAPLVARLQKNRKLGAVGPRLLFEDGTVQHEGMHYERLGSHGDWLFAIHTGKGGWPAPPSGLIPVRAITGACMVLRRAEVASLDPGYVIGDFEDADLCERLRAAGLGCAVDSSVTLYHLERQSQGAEQPWRANATLFNAWRFNRRWGKQIDG